MYVFKSLYLKRKRVLKTKLRIVTISGRKAVGWDGNRACFSNGSALILMLGDGFTCIHFKVYLVTYLNVTYILLCVLNIS